MVQTRWKTAADSGQINEIIAFATEDLRRVYRPVPRGDETASREEGQPMTLVAVEGDAVVGVVDYCLRHDDLHIRGLAVHPQQRKREVARELVRAIEQIALGCGKAMVTLSTIKETGNPLIFERLGFTMATEAPAEGFQSADGHHVIKADMCRVLA